MVLAIIGGRDFNLKEYAYSEIESRVQLDSITKIVSGGATGADSIAQDFAKDHNIPFEVFEADWKTFGKAAGPIRNTQIIKAADLIIAFDTGGPGTRNAIGQARKLDKQVIIVDCINKT